MPENRLPRAKTFQFLTSPFSAIFLVLLLFGLSWTQTTPSQQQSPNQGTTQVPGAGVAVQNQQQGSTPSPSAEQPEPQTRITNAQAKATGHRGLRRFLNNDIRRSFVKGLLFGPV